MNKRKPLTLCARSRVGCLGTPFGARSVQNVHDLTSVVARFHVDLETKGGVGGRLGGGGLGRGNRQLAGGVPGAVSGSREGFLSDRGGRSGLQGGGSHPALEGGHVEAGRPLD